MPTCDRAFGFAGAAFLAGAALAGAACWASAARLTDTAGWASEHARLGASLHLQQVPFRFMQLSNLLLHLGGCLKSAEVDVNADSFLVLQDGHWARGRAARAKRSHVQ
jgi:hypothetical protein